MRKPFPIKHALVWEAALCVFPHSGRSVMRDTVLSTFFARNRISYSRDNCLHSERWSPTSEADTHTAGGRWTYCTNTRSSPRTPSPPRLGNAAGFTAAGTSRGVRTPLRVPHTENLSLSASNAKRQCQINVVKVTLYLSVRRFHTYYCLTISWYWMPHNQPHTATVGIAATRQDKKFSLLCITVKNFQWTATFNKSQVVNEPNAKTWQLLRRLSLMQLCRWLRDPCGFASQRVQM